MSDPLSMLQDQLEQLNREKNDEIERLKARIDEVEGYLLDMAMQAATYREALERITTWPRRGNDDCMCVACEMCRLARTALHTKE